VLKYTTKDIHAVILTESFANLLKNQELALEVLRNFAINKNPSHSSSNKKYELASSLNSLLN
jgi:predicted transcriptional regulator